MNEISTTNKQTFFTVKEDSNYKVMLTYDREEVIEYEQFKKLALVLNDNSTPFVTINQRIVNKTTILDIAPTKELTEKQRQIRAEREAEAKAIQDHKDELTKLKHAFDVQFFNGKYGENKWARYAMFRKDENIHILTADDMAECWDEFAKTHPSQAKEIDDISLTS